jgi:low affinity Fe/Cu permease
MSAPVPQRPDNPLEFAHDQTARHNGAKLWFSTFANKTSGAVGSPITFLAAILMVVIWAALGPMYHYSNTWQLVINTGTTIITFLMVFLIQNTQNRDAKAIHLKLNELIHGSKRAQDDLIDVEKLSDEELKKLEEHYHRIRKECERRRASGENAA